MTQVPEAYDQTKKHILFHKYCITNKLVTLNSHMNSANKAICYAEVINMYFLRDLFNSTQHNAMVHTMHTGTSTQNVYFLPVEFSELVRK